MPPTSLYQIKAKSRSKANVTCAILNAKCELDAGVFLDFLTEIRNYCECEYAEVMSRAERSYEQTTSMAELV